MSCVKQVRSVLAELDGIEEDDVDIDFEAKTAMVDLADTKLRADDLMAAFKDTRFKVTPN